MSARPNPAKSPSPAKGSSVLRRLRIVAAFASILIALAAFIDFRDLVPNHLKHVYTSIQFVPSALTFATAFHATALACLLILALTFAFGRVYCSVICPLGILQDVISRISAKIRRKPPYKLPAKKAHNTLRHAILAATLLAIVAGWGGVALAWLDPYSHFGRFASTLFRPLAVVANNIAATVANALGHPAAIPQANVSFAAAGALLPPLLIFIAVAIMAAKRGRLWCNTVCPVGTLLGLVSRRALWRVSIDKTACVKCGDCLRACKAQCIDLRAAEIDFSRCVACYDCISVCDEGGVKYRWHGVSARRESRGISNLKSQIPNSIARPPSRANRRAFISTAMAGTLATVGATALLASRGIAQNGGRQGKGPKGLGQHGQGHGRGRDFSKLDNPEVVAPPGAQSVARILSQCTACQLCVSACPSHVLEPAFLEYGNLAGLMKPRLNFDKSFCNFDCTVCSDVCPDGTILHLARDAKHTTRIGLAHTAHPRCIIVKDGTACGACAEHCPTGALQMKKPPGHADAVPVVDPRYCIGCGACQYACPVTPKAIVISGIAKHETAEKLVQEQVAPTTTDDFAF
ncbi:ferredoxin [Ereboglobus sp. PH5-5]|uniref:4Fe-4S binding protein n=1 Tax=Ereboglobus sp. PH5-5 TaxID=2940529 RepID=UPI0024057996|nr:4Fe-4S binding protein [Ereboglobus sp. PH5-5]MDF9832764.1 ferredoxin [Ereboglobus sp. PH5-5]